MPSNRFSRFITLALLAGCSSQAPSTPVYDDLPPINNDADVVIAVDATDASRPDTTQPTDNPTPADNPPPADSGVDATTTPDAAMDATADVVLTGPSAQIRAVQTAAAGTVDLTVAGAVVTYMVPGFAGTDGGVSGNDPAGFFVQAEMTGPALFVAVDPATLSPRPALGDRVSFHVTMTRSVNAGATRWVSALNMYMRTETGVALAPLTQDLSSAADLVTGLNGYEHELITLSGVISGAGAAAGSSFQSFPITTAGLPTGDTGLRLRMPITVIASTGAREGCHFTITQTPLWRFNAGAQPSAWAASDVALTMCPAVVDAGVDAAVDTGVDATVTDTGVDASVDAGVDAAADTGVDASVDVAADVRTDTGTDAVSADVPGCSAHLVINEFTVAGPMGASDEFVELFNTGTCTVNLEGWTVKYASASGTTAASTKWTGAAGLTIAAGAYVVLAPSTATSYATQRNGVLDPGFAATGGALGLFAPGATTAHDAVAFGTAATTHPLLEGAAPAAVPTATQSTARIPNGADTNVNSADFRISTAITAGAVNR